MAIAGEATATVGTDGRTLGQRIVAAARLAVAVHLFESLAASTEHYGQQMSIGGAGPFVPATADRGHSRRPFRIHGGGNGGRADDAGAGSQ